MTSGLPFDDIRTLVRDLPALDAAARERVGARFRALPKPLASLGRLEEIAAWLAASTGRYPPRIDRPVVALFAGSHGVAAAGVSLRPMSDTQRIVELAAAGGAAINPLCLAADLGLKVFDLALDLPTADITADAALDERGCAATVAFGMEAVAGGTDLVCLGSIGVGGSTVAAAMLAAIHGGGAADWVEQGAGADTKVMARKRAAVEAALALHARHLSDPLEILRRLGGREIAAMVGAILAARTEKVPVILDGYEALAAASVLHALRADAISHCVIGQIADRPPHRRAAEALGLRPILDLAVTQGEGTGAALAAGIVKAAALVHAGMAPLPT